MKAPQFSQSQGHKYQIVADQNSLIMFNSPHVNFLKNPSEQEKFEKEQMKNYIKILCEEKTDPDVIFKVEDQKLPANKFLLCYRSSYFKKVFSSNMMESHNATIPIFHVRAKVFNVVLQYIHFEDFAIEDDILEDVFNISNEYDLKELQRECEKVFIRSIEAENVIRLTLFAEQFEAENLRKACLYFMANNYKEISQSPSFKDLDEGTCTEVLNLYKNSAKYDFKKRIIELSIIS